MSIQTDTRGVAGLIGALLLFAMLIIAFSSYQAYVVPSQNQEIEIQHNQEVHTEFTEFRTAVYMAGSTGNDQSQGFALGTQYPGRLIALNPLPAKGNLRTEPTGEIQIENAELQQSSNAALYWANDSNTYNTTGLTYDPQYNEYQNPPTTHYEHSFLYNDFEGGSVTVADQRLIQDGTISLWLLAGEVSEQGPSTTTVDLSPISVPKTTVPITNTEEGPVTLTLPTTLEPEQAEMFVTPEEQDSVSGVSIQNDQLQIVLEENQQYRLQIAQVGIGGSATTAEPAYIVPVVGGTGVVEGQSFTAEVRDRYNNPVSGVEVTANGCNGNLEPQQARTDNDGRASFTCTDVPSNQEETVSLTIGTEEWERVDFTIIGEPGGGQGQPGGPPGQN